MMILIETSMANRRNTRVRAFSTFQAVFQTIQDNYRCFRNKFKKHSDKRLHPGGD